MCRDECFCLRGNPMIFGVHVIFSWLALASPWKLVGVPPSRAPENTWSNPRTLGERGITKGLRNDLFLEYYSTVARLCEPQWWFEGKLKFERHWSRPQIPGHPIIVFDCLKLSKDPWHLSPSHFHTSLFCSLYLSSSSFSFLVSFSLVLPASLSPFSSPSLIYRTYARKIETFNSSISMRICKAK